METTPAQRRVKKTRCIYRQLHTPLPLKGKGAMPPCSNTDGPRDHDTRRSQTDKADREYCHSRVESKTRHKRTGNRLRTEKTALWLPRGKRLGKGGTGSLPSAEANQCIGSYQHSKTLLFSTGEPHAAPMRSHDGKGLEKNTQVTRALCCRAEIKTL